MILPDVNVLLYAFRTDSVDHPRYREWLDALVNGDEAYGMSPQVLCSVARLATHPRIWDPPSPLEAAVAQVEAWLESPSVELLAEGEDHWPTLRELLIGGRVAGPRIHDARIAALCLAHGVRELWTADRDFSRFPSLVTSNPLTA